MIYERGDLVLLSDLQPAHVFRVARVRRLDGGRQLLSLAALDGQPDGPLVAARTDAQVMPVLARQCADGALAPRGLLATGHPVVRLLEDGQR